MGKISWEPFRVGIVSDEVKDQGKYRYASPFSTLALACGAFSLAS